MRCLYARSRVTIPALTLILASTALVSASNPKNGEVIGPSGVTVDSSNAPSGQFGHFIYTGGENAEGERGTEIYGYSIDGPTGALTAVPLSPFAAGDDLVAMAAHSSGKFLYAVTTGQSGAHLAAFSVNSVTGGLTPIAGSPYPAGPAITTFYLNAPLPSVLAVAPNGKFLYVGNPFSNQVLGFSIDSTTGALNPISVSTVAGLGSLAVSPAGDHLYAAKPNDPSASIWVYSIDPSSGAVRANVQTTTGCGGEQMAIDSTGRYLYGLLNEGITPGITACQIDATTGKLSEINAEPFASNLNFSALGSHPFDGFLYAASQTSPSSEPFHFIYALTIDENTGALVVTPNSPFAMPPQNSIYGGVFGIAVEPHGKYAYVTQPGGGGAYSVDAVTGEFTLLSDVQGMGSLSIISSNQPWSPDLNWPAPSPITYGTPLDATQLDASAGVPGVFTYTPPVGTVLNAGSRTLNVSFAPTDSAEFTSQSTSVNLTVNKATPAITWATPAAITYGTALGSTQLNATATGVNSAALAGTFTYSPKAGSILKAGSYSLSVTFTPTDTTDYSTVTKSVMLTVNPATPATLASPAPSSVLTGSRVTFTWTAGVGDTGYSLRLGTSVGGNNLYGSGTITTTAVTVPNLPLNGQTIYARLYTTYASGGAYTDYVFTAASPATLTSPAPSSVLTGSKVMFSWTTGGGAINYSFRLGTSVGANNLYGSGTITGTSVTPDSLPTNGEKIYARLYTNFATGGNYTDYVFTAATQPSALITPASGSALTGSKVTFTWTPETNATAYSLRLGTTVGGNNLYGSGAVTGTTVTVSNLPTNGETIYARLYTSYASDGTYADYVFTAASLAALTSPAPSSVLTGSQVTFTWSAGGGASTYSFRLGTKAGGNDLYGSGSTTATTVTVSNLPTNGETIYGRLYTDFAVGGGYTDYVFTAISPAAKAPPRP